MDKKQWSEALKSFSGEKRKKKPVPDRSTLTEEEEWHCKMIGGEYSAWLQEGLDHIMRQRHVLQVMGFDPNPFIVFTSTMPGLVAAHEVMPELPEEFILLLHKEFKTWEKKNPLNDITFHIHHWSHVHGLGKRQLPHAKELHPDIKEEDFCLHSTGDLWGNNCGNFEEHLWYWTGEEMDLLEMNFSRGVY